MPLLAPRARDTLSRVERARREAEGRSGPEAQDLLLALSVLEETIAWDAAAPIATLPDDPCPVAVVSVRETAAGVELVLGATAAVGSALLLAGPDRAVVPALSRGERHRVLLRSRGPSVAVVRDERRWTLALPSG